MAVLRIPIDRSVKEQVFEVVLDGNVFTIELQLNRRSGFWTINLFDVEGNAVRHGIKLVAGALLFRQISLETRPGGELMMIDATGDDDEPTEDNLDEKVAAIYGEEAELP